MKITHDFESFLYRYFIATYDEVCKYCIHDIKCLRKDCDKYAEFSDVYEVKQAEDGTEYTVPVEMNGVWDCTMLNFGDCPKLEGTPCEHCLDRTFNNFEWNGITPTDY